MDNEIEVALQNAEQEEISGHLDNAIRLLSVSSNQWPNNTKILVKLAILHERTGDSASVEQTYRRIIQIDPHVHGAYSGLARILYEKGEADKAEIYINRAIELRPTAARWNIKGCILDALCREEEAEESFLNAIRADPNFSESYYNLAINRKLRKCYGEAAKLLEKAIDVDPGYAAAYAELGIIEAKYRNNLDTGEKLIRHSLELMDTSYWPHIYLSIILSLLGRDEEAEKERAIADLYRPNN